MSDTNAQGSTSTGRETQSKEKTTSRARHRLGSGEDPGVLALPARLKARLEGNVWLPLLGKATGAVTGMLLLAAVGAASTLAPPGLPIDGAPSAHAEASLGDTWLAPTRAPLRNVSHVPGGTPEPGAEHEPATHDEAPGHDSNAEAPPSEPGEDTNTNANDVAETPNDEADEATDDAQPSAAVGVTADGKVILNRADVAELTRLPGVGPKRAEAIAALRQRLGRFRRPTDLLRVKGIGVKTLRKMLPHLVLDPPKANVAEGAIAKPPKAGGGSES